MQSHSGLWVEREHMRSEWKQQHQVPKRLLRQEFHKILQAQKKRRQPPKQLLLQYVLLEKLLPSVLIEVKKANVFGRATFLGRVENVFPLALQWKNNLWSSGAFMKQAIISTSPRVMTVKPNCGKENYPKREHSFVMRRKNLIILLKLKWF